MGSTSLEGSILKNLVTLILGIVAALGPASSISASEATPELIGVIGAAGEPQYEPIFSESLLKLKRVAAEAKFGFTGIRPPEDASESEQKETLLQRLKSLEPQGLAPVWIVIVGHGSYDGRTAKFNLAGDDISATEFAEALEPIQRPMVVVVASSCSAPFLPQIAGENRVVITATRDGFEMNYSRFGPYFIDALGSQDADLDRDGQVSALEAFLKASADTRAFYQQEKRLATEHAILDDNGDGLGSPGDWFRGVQPVKRPKESQELDGFRANQLTLIPSESERALPLEARARRDDLERELLELKLEKDSLELEEYNEALEQILLEIAKIYFPENREETPQPSDEPTSE